MKNIKRITESDLVRLIKKVINEMDDSSYDYGKIENPFDTFSSTSSFEKNIVKPEPKDTEIKKNKKCFFYKNGFYLLKKDSLEELYKLIIDNSDGMVNKVDFDNQFMPPHLSFKQVKRVSLYVDKKFDTVINRKHEQIIDKLKDIVKSFLNECLKNDNLELKVIQVKFAIIYPQDPSQRRYSSRRPKFGSVAPYWLIPIIKTPQTRGFLFYIIC